MTSHDFVQLQLSASPSEATAEFQKQGCVHEEAQGES